MYSISCLHYVFHSANCIGINHALYNILSPNAFLLFRLHYKEYLVNKINKAKVDPVELYSVHQVKGILKREEVDVPEQEDNEEDVGYQARLVEVKYLIMQ